MLPDRVTERSSEAERHQTRSQHRAGQSAHTPERHDNDCHVNPLLGTVCQRPKSFCPKESHLHSALSTNLTK